MARQKRRKVVRFTVVISYNRGVVYVRNMSQLMHFFHPYIFEIGNKAGSPHFGSRWRSIPEWQKAKDDMKNSMQICYSFLQELQV